MTQALMFQCCYLRYPACCTSWPCLSSGSLGHAGDNDGEGVSKLYVNKGFIYM